MRIVVADTSPLCYLLEIGEIELLPRLFETVTIPSVVRDELLHVSAPAAVQGWMSASPGGWMSGQRRLARIAAFRALDEGERAAIVLGLSLGTDIILIDDRKGAAVARSVNELEPRDADIWYKIRTQSRREAAVRKAEEEAARKRQWEADLLKRAAEIEQEIRRRVEQAANKGERECLLSHENHHDLWKRGIFGDKLNFQPYSNEKVIIEFCSREGLSLDFKYYGNDGYWGQNEDEGRSSQHNGPMMRSAEI